MASTLLGIIVKRTRRCPRNRLCRAAASRAPDEVWLERWLAAQPATSVLGNGGEPVGCVLCGFSTAATAEACCTERSGG